MDEIYDVIVLGTGLTECVISSICSQKKMKVLHMDRNKYYGGESTSLTPLDNLYRHFDKKDEKQIMAKMGPLRDWNVDLIPKFLMAEGNLVKLLIHTGVTRYLEFKVSEGSYVRKGEKICKLPTNSAEGLTSGFLGFFEKNKLKNFLSFVQQLDLDNTATNKQYKDAQSWKTTADMFAHFNLNAGVQAAVGHAIALHRNDDYLKEHWLDTVKRVQLYFNSISRYGGSPFLYPLYGLGELPQGFARICAVYGGTYMLDKQIDCVSKECDGLYHVKSGEETVRGKIIVADPSYFPDKVKETGKVIRTICLLSHPVAETNKNSSCQIIIPSTESTRKNDIYICVVSHAHNVCAKERFLAIVSTTQETDGDPEKEIEVGLNLLGVIDDKFTKVYPTYEPIEDGRDSNLFISKSYDATTHFETTCDDIMSLYERKFGEKFDFSKVKSTLNQPEEEG